MGESTHVMNDDHYMQRALDLAELGRGYVSPNPMVGCVVVYGERIIGEGHHRKYGEAHAEVNAINSVKDQSLLTKSTVYVTLEPCAHHGKTPPCADLLIEKKVKRVVVACRDPFEEVDGKGIEKLQDAGIDVEVGILEKEAKALNKRFFISILKKRPYVILKWAQTGDGFVARENYDSKWISNQYSRQLVHRWRAEEDAILVGKQTAMYDNPSLTVRDWKGKNPIRVLLDSKLEVGQDSSIYNDEAKTLSLNTLKAENIGTNIWIQVDKITPQSILNKLNDHRIQSVIIEGGSQVLNSFIKENCWDEARIFTSKQQFAKGISAPLLKGEIVEEASIFEDRLTIIKNNHG